MAAVTSSERKTRVGKLEAALAREKKKSARLSRQAKEALEREAATAEVLRAISASPSDAQPVFDLVVERAAALCGAADGVVLRHQDGLVHLAAHHNMTPGAREALRSAFPCTLQENIASVQAIRTASVVQVPDINDVPLYPLAQVAQAGGIRRVLAVPLLRGGRAIGAVAVGHAEPGHFSDHQIGLVKTFADQAVIAIENVRLFNETKEALEKQTATAEILGVISSTPTDTLPVFEAIVHRATRLCEAVYANVFRYDGEQLHLVTSDGWEPELVSVLKTAFPAKPDRSRVAGRVVLDRQAVRVEDTRLDPDYDPDLADRLRHRRILGVPLLRSGEVVGVITVRWAEPGPIEPRHEELLKTFAAQAVIAIENVRLFNETKEALERQTATSEILDVMSRSQTNLQPVFDSIATNAMRLCEGDQGLVFSYDGERMDIVGLKAMSLEGESATRRLFPAPPDRGNITGRAILTRAVAQSADVLSDAEYQIGSAAQVGGWRSVLSVPMLRAGEPIGAITVTRHRPMGFTENQMALLKTFADQAVIAIENTRLFKELQERTEALSRTVGQLTALGEVGQAISSTLDLEKVLQTIVSRAVELTGLDAGALYESDEERRLFNLRASQNIPRELLDLYRDEPVRFGEGAVGGTADTHEPIQVADILEGSYQSRARDILIRSGARALLAVPLLREGHVLGALAVIRNQRGEFAPEVVALLRTFATQSAIAIQNARLFREIADKGRQLEEASRHKSHFLASMSHELRTPLNAILGFNEMILGEIYGEVPADMSGPLQDIQTSGKHLLRLINNVLDLAKIEAGRMELALADYSVHDMVESVRATLRPLAEGKGLEFLASVPEGLPLAHGDFGRLTQCLMNLAGNSLKFTKSGHVSISVVPNGASLAFRVADSGIGIGSDKIDSLFTEFKQTDATIASEYGGTGLGLSITKKFIEMHGGRIWVESEPGKGSTFIFEIPLRAATGVPA